MSVPAADWPSVAFQDSVTGDNLNSTLLNTFTMGIYTVVYTGTLFLYLTRKASQRWMVIASITMLYLLAMIELGAQWYSLQWTFVVNGETRESIFLSEVFVPEWIPSLSSISQITMVVLADGLLIWRCFFVWNRSLRVILLPLLLFFVEIVLSITYIAVGTPTPAKLRLFSVLASTLFFISFLGSLMATLLIAFRIHSASKLHGTSGKKLRHIIEILVHSAVFYSLAVLVQALVNVFPSSGTFGSYSEALSIPITGIAPTVMVARVCIAADTGTHLSTTHHLSGLQFQGRSTSHDETHIGTQRNSEINEDAIVPQEGKTGMV